jgi:uncharacterized protein (TIGR02231 family)
MRLVQQIIQTQINAVTVYQDRALIIRRGKIELTGSEKELIVENLPISLQTDSVRIAGSGAIAVKILSARCETVFTEEPVANNIAQIERQIKNLELERKTFTERISTLKLQRKFVENLSEKSIQHFSRGLAKQEVTLDETQELLNFVGQQYSEYTQQISQLEREKQIVEERLQIWLQQKQQLQTPKTNQSIKTIVAIEPAGEGEFELELTYIVQAASWTPLYDLSIDTVQKHLHLGYLGEVRQNTGEDWLGVMLTLSTAKPGYGSLPPQPSPWYINTYIPPNVYSAMRLSRAAQPQPFSSSAPTTDLSMRAETEALEESKFQAETVVAEIQREGSVVTFQIGDGGNIPGDGMPHKVTIFRDEYPCNLQYVVMPRLVSFAYLQAKAKNSPTGATLLPGKANIFRDRAFVGTIQLDNISPGQEFKINLGIDEGIEIERTLVERQVDKKLIGTNRKTTFAYRLQASNLLAQETFLQLIEQIPVSRDERIKVRLHQINPKIDLGEMGVLEWNLSLAPNAKQEIYYQFIIEHPAEISVVGLNI